MSSAPPVQSPEVLRIVTPLTVEELESQGALYTAPDGAILDVPGFEKGEARVAQYLSTQGRVFSRRVIIWDVKGLPNEVSSLSVHRYLAKRDARGNPVFFSKRPDVPAVELLFTCPYPNGQGGTCGKRFLDDANGEIHARRYHQAEYKTRKAAEEKEQITNLKAMVAALQTQVATVIGAQMAGPSQSSPTRESKRPRRAASMQNLAKARLALAAKRQAEQ